MMQHCKTLFGNGLLCNTPYVRMIALGGVVEYYKLFGRRIDYCPQCGHELTVVDVDDDPRTCAELAADEWQLEYLEDTRALVLGL